VRTTRILPLIFISAYVLIVSFYRVNLIGPIDHSRPDFREHYSGLFLTDSVEYFIYYSENFRDWFIQLLSGDRKNYLAPVALVATTHNIEYGDLIANFAIFSIFLFFVMKINTKYLQSKLLLVIMLFVNVDIIYYMNGYNKEMLLLSCSAAFIYSIIEKKYLLSIIVASVAMVTRLHIGVAFFFTIFMTLLFAKKKVKIDFVFFSVILITLVLPYIIQIIGVPFIGAAEQLYSRSENLRVGEIAFGIISVPLGGLLGIPIRIVQHLMEPVIYVFYPQPNPFIFFSGVVNLFLWILFFREVAIYNWGRDRGRSEILRSIYTLVIAVLVIVGLNPITHARYLFLITPLLPMVILLRTRLLVRQKMICIPIGNSSHKE